MYTLRRKFHFDAAHYLPTHPGACKNVHGHTWHVTVMVSAPDLNNQHMVIDLKDLKDIFNNYIMSYLDHAFVNEKFPALYPTCENIAKFIYQLLYKPIGKTMEERKFYLTIEVQEGEGGSAIYEEDKDGLR